MKTKTKGRGIYRVDTSCLRKNKPIFMIVSAQKISGKIQKKLFPVAASGKGDWAIMGQGRKEELIFTPYPFVPFGVNTVYIYYLFKIISSI